MATLGKREVEEDRWGRRGEAGGSLRRPLGGSAFGRPWGVLGVPWNSFLKDLGDALGHPSERSLEKPWKKRGSALEAFISNSTAFQLSRSSSS